MLTHASFAGLYILFQESVNHVIELHQAMVFPEVIFRFTQDIVNPPVRPSNANFARFLEGVEDLSIVEDG
jgi:hypothetical protein